MADRGGGRSAALMGLSGQTLLILAVIVLLIAAAYRLDRHADWSYYGRFTLHPELHRLLDRQSEPVAITGLWPRALGDASSRSLLDNLDRGLQSIAAETPLIDYRQIDPDLHQPELQAFTRQHGEAAPFSIYLMRGERRFRIPISGESERTLQRDVGGALQALADPDPTPVYFLSGHGELNPHGSGPDGASALWQTVTLNGFQTLLLRSQEIDRYGRLPDDGVLVIAGPTGPLGPDLLDHLAVYLRDGGAVLILADDRCPHDLTTFLRYRGVLLGTAIPERWHEQPLEAFFGPPPPPSQPLTLQSATESMVGRDQRFDRLRLGTDHIQASPVTDRILRQGRDILSPRTTPLLTAATPTIAQALGRETNERFAAVGTPPFEILAHLIDIDSGTSWLTLADDWTAPVTRPRSGTRHAILAVLANEPHSQSVRPDQGARLVVWGSRQAASDAVLRQDIYANEDLLVDLITWLADRGEATVIPPADYAPIRVTASDGQMQVIFILLIIVVPCLCLGAAMITWWENRR